jgi:hypothetical protein
MAKRSTDKLGNDWSAQAIVLAGDSSSIISGANAPARYPSVAIYRELGNISNNTIHLVWTRVQGGKYSICYSKCINITDNKNFSKSLCWRKGNNELGFDVLEENVNLDSADNYGYPCIAADRFNQSHVVWHQEYLYNSKLYFKINYTTWNKTNGWHNGNPSGISITPWLGYNYSHPSLDVGFNGTIHTSYKNKSVGIYHRINYRQCWELSDSMNINNWGNASRIPGKEDMIMATANSHMREPSLVCDFQGWVWVVTCNGSDDYNIWYAMEDFQDIHHWPQEFTIAETGKLSNPTIGFDSSGTVYCVWQREITASDIRICYSYNSSSSWSMPVEIMTGNKNILPQIPKNLSVPGNQISFIFKDDTNSNIIFLSIPEFSELMQYLFLFLIIQIMVMTTSKRHWSLNNKWRKVR